MIDAEDLKHMQPEKAFFIGLDSDGCVFDSMELKHKECFCPAFINHYRLQGVCRYARETWEFVNLYSATRGVNRFKAVLEALRLLAVRPEVQQQLGRLLPTDDLEAWIAEESCLSNSVLQKYIEDHRDTLEANSILHISLTWSHDVAEAVEKIVHDLPPIAEAVATLEVMHANADCVVVSQTPATDLIREWNEHGIDRFPRLIAGQEQGTKTEHLAMAAGTKYAPGHVLMVGDAPGDHQSAADNDFLFFPIRPGSEAESWRELRENGLAHFFNGTYAGEYQHNLLEAFHKCLPEQPTWNRR